MITFTVTFHGPFHVGTGSAEGGLDRPVDRSNLLPASSLKGLMRAEAAEVLGVRPDLVSAIFGREGRAGSWWWGDARFPPNTVTFGQSARIRVDGDGVVEAGFLALSEHTWVDRATFEVGPSRALSAVETTRHTTVLRAAARSVTALGGGRRRGEGWVSIVDDQDPWTSFDTSLLLGCRRSS